MNDTTSFVYGRVSAIYSASGLGSPLPIKSGRKSPPPAGYTGRSGVRPTYARLAEWTTFWPYANVAIRLAPEVVGIDVDAHGEHDGAASFNKMIRQHGPLPTTYISTARGCDDPSGIRLLRLPNGTDEKDLGERFAGDGIDVIRQSHRYLLVWPSTHPNGGTYRWYVDGIEEPPPTFQDLGMLPAGWVEHLTGTCDCFAVEPLSRDEWLADAKTRAHRGVGSRPTSSIPAEARKRGAVKILDRRAARLAAVTVGSRNNETYRAAFGMFGRFALNERSLTVTEVYDSLLGAATANGLVQDSGRHAVDATLHSAFRDAERALGRGEFDDRR